jgi:nitrate reductase gamma subunit
MSEWLHRFFFQFFPYISVTVLILGSWLRYDRDQYSWRSSSSEMMRKRQLVIGSAPIWYLGRAYQVVRVPYRKGARR